MTRQQRRMASMVRAIRAGEWTADAPDWADHVLQECDGGACIDVSAVVRAVQTAEAFIVLLLAENPGFNTREFLRACNLVR